MKDLQSLFVYYDIDKDGFINYSEFCKGLFGSAVEAKQNMPVGPQKDIRADNLVDMLKKKLNERGVKGIMGLMKSFKQIDKDKSGTLSPDEFKIGMKEYKLAFDDGDLEIIFKEFDKDRDSSISQPEFFRFLIGDLNDFRAKLTNKLFDELDVKKEGKIDINDLKKKFIAREHPAVLAGRKTESNVIDDLAAAIDIYLNCYEVGKDGKISRPEMLEFFRHISANIDNDAYFEKMVNNCWSLKPEKPIENLPIPQPVPQPAPIVQPTIQPSGEDKKLQNIPAEISPSKVPEKVESIQNEGPISLDTPATRFRNAAIARGTRGVLGIQRQFKVYTKADMLELDDFKKAVEDFRLPVSVEDLEALFKDLDKNGQNKISYTDVMKTIISPMPENRKKYVEAAFQIADKDKDGIIDSEDISRSFEAWKHPDAKNNKRRPEDILHDVLEVLDNCTALHRGTKTDGRYKKEEFYKYFEYISACIPYDTDFQDMFTLLWRVDKNALPATILQEPSPYIPSPPPIAPLNPPVTDQQTQKIEEQPKPSPINQPIKEPEEQKSVPKTPEKSYVPQSPIEHSPFLPKTPVSEPAQTPITAPAQAVEQNSEQDEWTNTEILDYIKMGISKAGVNGVFNFMKNLTKLGKTGKINQADLVSILSKMNVKLTPTNIEKLTMLFASENDMISTDEFSKTVVGEMTMERANVIEKVFKKLDKDNDSIITTQDIIANYDASKNPEVLAKKKSEKQILAMFLDIIEMFLSTVVFF